MGKTICATAEFRFVPERLRRGAHSLGRHLGGLALVAVAAPLALVGIILVARHP
jgi:hypothetical protein